jgi:hypothetical protein
LQREREEFSKILLSDLDSAATCFGLAVPQDLAAAVAYSYRWSGDHYQHFGVDGPTLCSKMRACFTGISTSTISLKLLHNLLRK